MVLDMLAERPDVNDIPCVLVEYLDAHLPKGTLRDDAMKVALSRYLTPTDETIPDKPAERLQAAELSPTVRALLRTETAQLYLASSRVCDDLQKKRLPKYFRRHIKPELIRAVASAIEPDAKIRKRLLKAVAPGSPEENHAAVAGILNATSHGWRPTPGKLPNLEGAYLAGARWDRVSLVRGRCRRANLARAILRESDMESCDLGEAVLTRADLTGACLNNASCNGTSFNYAQLCHCRSETTNYFFADLVRADFTGANLKWATLVGTDCRDARFVRADLTRAHIFKANISGVDFTSASLRASEVSGMDFRATLLRGTSFARTKCVRCNFEDVDFPIADFYAADLVGALFTGANMPNAIFGEADLRETGLFEVNWPGADLRGADLRGASFHAGSSRSGLVGSPIASEGTRTGFYTDEYLDQSYRAPEEIRVANLRGADLRGADIFETDFYLVDLREAKYHGPQAEHLRKCGAILEARV